MDLVGIVEKRDQILDDASDEAPAIHIEALLLVRSSDSEARERTQVPEDARLERRADDDREGADPVELHRNGDDHRSKVRFEGPLVHVNEEGCGEPGVLGCGSLGKHSAGEEGHVHRPLNLVEVDGGAQVKEPVKDDLPLHAARASWRRA